jgi:calcineurin-like phosphoesterase
VATICGVMVETDNQTGLAEAIHPLRDGGELSPVLPPGP